MNTKARQGVEMLLPPDFDLPGPGGDSHQTFPPRGCRKSLAGRVSKFVLRASWNYVLKPMVIVAAFGWGATWLFPSLLMGIGASLTSYVHEIDVNGLAEWASEAWKNLI